MSATVAIRQYATPAPIPEGTSLASNDNIGLWTR